MQYTVRIKKSEKRDSQQWHAVIFDPWQKFVGSLWGDDEKTVFQWAEQFVQDRIGGESVSEVVGHTYLMGA